MGRACGRKELHAVFHWNLKDGDHLEDLTIDWKWVAEEP
jgi:hypothetical protein